MKKQPEKGISPLLLIGTLIVLFPIFAWVTIDSINMHSKQSLRLLSDKSSAIIFAIEAGTRSFFMDTGWNKNPLINLLKETSKLPGVKYIYITDVNGKILLPTETGSEHISKEELHEASDAKLQWRKLNMDNKPVFEAFKKFEPLKTRGRGFGRKFFAMHRGMHGKGFNNSIDIENAYIFVGISMEEIEKTIQNDTNHTMFMSVTLLIIGFAGFMLIFIVQRFRAARSSLTQMKIFSDNLVENMPIGLIALDPDRKVVSVNPAAVSILGFVTDIEDKNATDVLPHELVESLVAAEKTNTLVEKEITVEAGNEKRIIDMLTTPLLSEDYFLYGSLILLRDFTKIRNLEKEIIQNEKLASIGRLAAGVAHEIRNPLSSLKGYATYFKEVFEKDSGEQKIALTMINEVDRLNRVVSDLVELAKPVNLSGKMILIKELIDDSVRQIEIEAKRREIEIVYDVDSETEVFADEDRLRQVLLNLYLNAMDAMEEIKGKITITSVKKESGVHIKIEDTGKGIEKDALSRIFEPYFTTKQTGTGLGLSIVHNIIKAHNGEIIADSSPGIGTSFEIILPVKGYNNG